MEFFRLELSDGSAIEYDADGDGLFRIIDHTGVPFFAGIGGDPLWRLLDGIATCDHGFAPIDGDTQIVIAWIYDGRDGSIIYVHAQDRSGSLAPVYITRRERVELGRLIG